MPECRIITSEQSPVWNKQSGCMTTATEGRPFEDCRIYDNHTSNNFRSGIWNCKAGSWFHEHPKTELCYIVEGSVKIHEQDGPLHEYTAGDAFIVPMGTPVIWIVEDYVKKIFVSAQKLDDDH